MLFNHRELSLVSGIFSDLLQIVFRTTTVWTIDCYPAIPFCGEIIIVGS